MIIDGKLPASWIKITISEICLVNPTVDKSKYADDLLVSFVPMPAVEAETGRIDVSETKLFQSVKKGYTPFQKDDVLFAKITPCMENGKMAVVPEVANDIAFGSTEFQVLRAFSGVLPKFIYYFVSSKMFRQDAEHNMAGAVGQRRVPKPYLEQSDIPLPPLNEQYRIVAKIEELFSEIDKGVESLKTAKAQLQVYRQALLKHAFEGKLTAQWRADNPDKVVPAAELLRSIEQAREERYQQQLTDWQTAIEKWEFSGKDGKKPSKPKKILDIEQFSDAEKSLLPNLPDNWLWMRLAQIVEKIQIGPFGSLLHKEDYILDGIPLVNPVHIQAQKIIPHSNSTVSQEKIKELGIYRLKENDIVLGRRGEMGRCAVVNQLEDGWLCGSGSLYIRLLSIETSQFYCQVLSSRRVKDYLTDSSIGTTMDNLNQNILNNVPIPLCSTTELKVIEEELERQFLYVDRSLADIDLNLQKAEILRQSILKKAFSGQLVPQDPNDEPASELLKRIQAEKVERETTTKKQKVRSSK